MTRRATRRKWVATRSLSFVIRPTHRWKGKYSKYTVYWMTCFCFGQSGKRNRAKLFIQAVGCGEMFKLLLGADMLVTGWLSLVAAFEVVGPALLKAGTTLKVDQMLSKHAPKGLCV